MGKRQIRESLKQQLIEHIIKAFDSVPPPPFWGIVSSCIGFEPQDVANDFKNRLDRYNIDPDFLDKSPNGLSSALSFFSDSAFWYYMPAYMIADVQRKLERVDLIFHLTHGFTNDSKKKKIGCDYERTWFDSRKYKMSYINQEQIDVVIEYLNYKKDNSRVSCFEKEKIEEALENYWQIRNKPNFHISGKFLAIASEALKYRIDSMYQLICDDDTPEEQLEEIAHGNDIYILEAILKEWEKIDKGDE